MQVRLRNTFAKAWHEMAKYFDAMSCKALGAYDQKYPAEWGSMKEALEKTVALE